MGACFSSAAYKITLHPPGKPAVQSDDESLVKACREALPQEAVPSSMCLPGHFILATENYTLKGPDMESSRLGVATEETGFMECEPPSTGTSCVQSHLTFKFLKIQSMFIESSLMSWVLGT